MPLLFEEQINLPNGPLTPEQLCLLLEGCKAGSKKDAMIWRIFYLSAVILAFCPCWRIVIRRCCRRPGTP